MYPLGVGCETSPGSASEEEEKLAGQPGWVEGSPMLLKIAMESTMRLQIASNRFGPAEGQGKLERR